MDIRTIELKLSKFVKELETEDRLNRVGLKDKLDTEAIYKKYNDLFSQEIRNFLENEIKGEKNKVKKEELERVYYTIVSSFIGHELARESDSIKSFYSTSKVKFNGDEEYYFQIAPLVSKEVIYDKREKMDEAASKVVAKANSKHLKLLQKEIEILEKLGFSGYLDYFTKSKKFNYSGFYKLIARIKKQTDKIWDKQIQEISQEVFKRPFKKIPSAHMQYLRSMSMFDSFYPVDRVEPVFLKFVKDIGLSDLLGHISIDDKSRPKKNPRAVCYWADPPKEVHLIIKPIGGEQDYEAMFHEGGHALHGAAVDEKLPFPFRVLSRSNALTEAYAFVLEDLVFTPAWLSANLNVSSFTANRISVQAHFVNLMLLRRYLAKFAYEYEVFSKNTISGGAKIYKKNLDDFTGFVHREINYLNDMDGGFYSAEYIRAWIGAAQIKHYLNRKFGEKWFKDPKAGRFLRDLYSQGVSSELEDVVGKLGYKPLDIKYLIDSYKKALV